MDGRSVDTFSRAGNLEFFRAASLDLFSKAASLDPFTKAGSLDSFSKAGSVDSFSNAGSLDFFPGLAGWTLSRADRWVADACDACLEGQRQKRFLFGCEFRVTRCELRREL
jgi:hypothetical protein